MNSSNTLSRAISRLLFISYSPRSIWLRMFETFSCRISGRELMMFNSLPSGVTVNVSINPIGESISISPIWLIPSVFCCWKFVSVLVLKSEISMIPHLAFMTAGKKSVIFPERLTAGGCLLPAVVYCDCLESFIRR